MLPCCPYHYDDSLLTCVYISYLIIFCIFCFPILVFLVFFLCWTSEAARKQHPDQVYNCKMSQTSPSHPLLPHNNFNLHDHPAWWPTAYCWVLTALHGSCLDSQTSVSANQRTATDLFQPIRCQIELQTKQYTVAVRCSLRIL